MKQELSLGDQISRVEKRIEARRERTVRHYEITRSEVKERVAKVVSWWPLVAVAGSLAIGIAAARLPRKRRQVEHVRYVQARPTAKTRNILASIAAIAATAMRIAASHEARTMWGALRTFRARRHARH